MLELVAIIVTGVLSLMDLIVNIAGMCMSGHCKSSCCGIVEVEHDEDG